MTSPPNLWLLAHNDELWAGVVEDIDESFRGDDIDRDDAAVALALYELIATRRAAGATEEER